MEIMVYNSYYKLLSPRDDKLVMELSESGLKPQPFTASPIKRSKVYKLVINGVGLDDPSQTEFNQIYIHSHPKYEKIII